MDYMARLQQAMQAMDHSNIDIGIGLVESAWREGRQIFVFGNGGSGSTASHMTCDWNKGIGYGKVHRPRVQCLNDNIPTLLAYANDLSYDEVFVQQLRNFVNKGDLVVGISGSGNSPNILRAMEFANEQQAVTLGLSGHSGGKLLQIARYNVIVPINDMQLVEDLHLVFGHMVMQKLLGQDC